MERKPRLFILCGPPFSGKSTLAREMEERFGLVRIEIDEEHLRHSTARTPAIDWRIAFQRSFRRLHNALERGDSVVWDSASLTRAQRDRIRATGERYGYSCALIEVATSIEERWRRKELNRRTRVRADVPDDAFDEAQRNFEPPAEDERPLRLTEHDDLNRWLEEHIAPLLAVTKRRD